MGEILQRRLATSRRFHPGEEAALALAIAAGELGSVVENVLRQRGLTHTRYNVLRIVRGAGDSGISHAEIASRLLVPSPDVTRLVDRLVEAGWVERERSQEDRRIVIQRLTGAGRRLLESLDEPLSAVHESVVRALGPAAAADLVRRCESVIEAVQSGTIAAGERSNQRAD